MIHRQLQGSEHQEDDPAPGFQGQEQDGTYSHLPKAMADAICAPWGRPSRFALIEQQEENQTPRRHWRAVLDRRRSQ